MSRRHVAGAATLAASVTLVGCVPMLPSRPLALQPISVTAVDDRFSWVQCTAKDIRVTYVSLTVREESDRGHEWQVFKVDGEPDDAVSIMPEKPVDLDQSFVGLPVVATVDLPVSSLRGPVTIFLLLDGPDTRAEMVYRDVDPTDLANGKYVYASGEVSDSPCDMPRD